MEERTALLRRLVDALKRVLDERAPGALPPAFFAALVSQTERVLSSVKCPPLDAPDAPDDRRPESGDDSLDELAVIVDEAISLDGKSKACSESAPDAKRTAHVPSERSEENVSDAPSDQQKNAMSTRPKKSSPIVEERRRSRIDRCKKKFKAIREHRKDKNTSQSKANRESSAESPLNISSSENETEDIARSKDDAPSEERKSPEHQARPESASLKPFLIKCVKMETLLRPEALKKYKQSFSEKTSTLPETFPCSVRVVAYDKRSNHMKKLLETHRLKKLYDERSDLVLDLGPSFEENEIIKKMLIKSSSESEDENEPPKVNSREFESEDKESTAKLTNRRKRNKKDAPKEKIKKRVRFITSNAEDEDGRSSRNSNISPSEAEIHNTSDTRQIENDDSNNCNSSSLFNVEKSKLEKCDDLIANSNNKNTAVDPIVSDDVNEKYIDEFLKSATENTMAAITSELLNGDTSASEEELSPKINGKESLDVRNKKNSNGNDSDNSMNRSHDKNATETVEIDSDSDSSKNSDNDEEDNKSEENKNNDSKDDILLTTDSNDSDVVAPKKRKKKVAAASSDESPVESNQKKKRRRIKEVSDEESDKSGAKSDDDSDGDTNKKGRKNIRKVKRSVNLDEATKIAARNEKERVQRILERQKLYNECLFDESGRPDEVIKLDKVVLDFHPDTKEPLISVDKGLVKKLKPHQANGVKFMWDACFESVKQIKEGKGSGCILAHCMGLGKTLQVITLTHTLLTHQKLTRVERVLVVCPLSTVLNWVNEFHMWLKFAKCKDEILIYELSRYKQNYERSNKLKEWFEEGGVCVLGYDMFRNLSADNSKKFRKAQLTAFQKSLVDPGPDLVICDEGHLLKNEKTSLSQAMNRVKTLRRIVLTGTPLQNNLKEYYCMVQFVKPNLLGKYNEYLNRFVNPITNGQYTDSTEHDIRLMKRRSHVLHTMLDGAVQRRDYSVLAPFLPPKHEYVLFITLTDIQIKLYSHYMENYSRRPRPDRKSSGFLFPDFQALQRIWTHPLVLKANSERYEIMQQKKREKEEEDSEGSLVDFINDDSTTPDETSESDETTEDSDDSSNANKKKKKKKTPPKRVTRSAPQQSDDDVEVKIEEPRLENPTEWWMSLCSEDELDDVRHSNKLILLLDILKECDAIGDKVLVFSQSLYSLDLIEQFLWKIDEATQKSEKNEKLFGHIGSWSPGLDYFRLDGSTSCENRAIWCKSFNREDNPRARLFLISTRAGGLGINLVAANRVVIFDMSWNPSHDVQSIFRVYRFGQKKPCYIYRFLALGTMEEKIYERQVTKQAISKRVIDEQQIDRHYAESDLAELYNFCPVPEGQREVPKLPKDRLFAELLRQHDKMIYKYHEHDSLLENKEEETLSEEERKAAWEDYENEKTRPPQTFGNHILAGFQQQQQHHLAMTAILQQEFPGLNEQQIASMIPSLLQQMYQNGDQALMQKVNAVMAAQNSLMGFKYPQVNSNMQPMMNSGTSSNFQQSWQQQQQLRLQQIQQQQAMQSNLKYYAGGLGSRDTIDMATLQQQQRALMMAANANIPQRGRPPKNMNVLQYPTMPPILPKPTTTNDIVDLDSE